ncbi:hypothetical protein HOS78_gp059 [Lactobacillus phage Bacchae]|uniref:Uncharacterized protein n=1 Tax=Lactobacillus phage Bacchae TaxID=2079429 RepID=A0A2K9VCR9_9CAUD|nr:hypothetical protein HOS78_gp059 [Lactobacillus phage Bacchae]AUV59995.1 hypothetical protein [Lactobacillus phage Bacchae]
MKDDNQLEEVNKVMKKFYREHKHELDKKYKELKAYNDAHDAEFVKKLKDEISKNHK